MDSLLEKVKNNKVQVAVVGLGYVGMPLAAAFAKKGISVIGYDINEKRITELREGVDRTNEVDSGTLKALNNIEYTSNPEDLKKAEIYIITVPTPLDEYKAPDLKAIKGASETIGNSLGEGNIVVLESTVYPGVTEETVVPILENKSGLKYLKNFTAGYSPERINPGDSEHNLETVTKVVSGSDSETTETLKELYGKVSNSIFVAKNIKVAEGAKVIENTQRDINIALMNELAVLFDKLDISIWDVLEAAGTKWNFLKFTPGLVGGHCIPVDPYYLLYRAEKAGYHPQVIASGRRISDSMPKYIVEKVLKALNKAEKAAKTTKCLIMGLTFKENVPDTRSSLALEVLKELKGYGADIYVLEPLIPAEQLKEKFGVNVIQSVDEAKDMDIILITVAHDEFISIPPEKYIEMGNEGGVVFDVKHILKKKDFEGKGREYLTL